MHAEVPLIETNVYQVMIKKSLEYEKSMKWQMIKI